MKLHDHRAFAVHRRVVGAEFGVGYDRVDVAVFRGPPLRSDAFVLEQGSQSGGIAEERDGELFAIDAIDPSGQATRLQKILVQGALAFGCEFLRFRADPEVAAEVVLRRGGCKVEQQRIANGDVSQGDLFIALPDASSAIHEQFFMTRIALVVGKALPNNFEHALVVACAREIYFVEAIGNSRGGEPRVFIRHERNLAEGAVLILVEREFEAGSQRQIPQVGLRAPVFDHGVGEQSEIDEFSGGAASELPGSMNEIGFEQFSAAAMLRASWRKLAGLQPIPREPVVGRIGAVRKIRIRRRGRRRNRRPSANQ
ncbi:MAG TPA: hypothetical protein VHX65_02515 [Pirellulales bacterium]|nr:hypothetical protein [Pirellulales bacterium]